MISPVFIKFIKSGFIEYVDFHFHFFSRIFSHFILVVQIKILKFLGIYIFRGILVKGLKISSLFTPLFTNFPVVR